MLTNVILMKYLMHIGILSTTAMLMLNVQTPKDRFTATVSLVTLVMESRVLVKIEIHKVTF